ncbi:MAG: holo-ACP synthase [Acidimicrobiia bacterium]
MSTGTGVLGLGTDLVEVERFRLAVTRRSSLAERMFSDAEREYALSQYDPAKSLAARFAAKEAVMKALGVGLGSFALRDVEVKRDDTGAPSLELHGRADELARTRGVTGWMLSLSHTDTTAMAVAIATGQIATGQIATR